jgi:hypothetical protein
MNIQVGFSTSKNSWISKIIRWFTDSTVSHCFFIYWDKDWQRDMILEATEGGFKITPFSNYEKDLVAAFTPKYSVEQGLIKSIDWLGEDYDYVGLIGMIWVELGRWLHRKWRNPWRDAKSMFCSEAISRIMIESNYPGTSGWDPQSIDPQMLMNFFSKEV